MSIASVSIQIDLNKVSNLDFINELKERIEMLSNTLSTRELEELKIIIQQTVDKRIQNPQTSILDYTE